MSTATEATVEQDRQAQPPRARRAGPPTARVAAVTVVTAALALLVTACGGSAPSSGSQASATASPIAFARCMRSHGVPRWPDPTPSGSFDKSELTPQRLAVSGSQLQEAQNTCLHLLPTESGTQRHPDPAQALRFSECMRSHGVTSFPDPDGTGRIPDPASVGVDQGSQLFEAANHACRTYRPAYIPSNAAYESWARTHGS